LHKHVLSGDIAREVAAVAERGKGAPALRRMRHARNVQQKKPKKKGTFATPREKKALAKARACVIFRADSLFAVKLLPRIATLNSRGVGQNGEKGWRTDEVGSPDTDLQGHGTLTQAGR
jgi:hypothetical protein